MQKHIQGKKLEKVNNQVKVERTKGLRKDIRMGQFERQWTPFLRFQASWFIHLLKEQSNHFQLKILGVPASSTVIQVDFSENYSLQNQGEVKSVCWNEDQLTLFSLCLNVQNKEVCK